jgi:hypothetical protein
MLVTMSAPFSPWASGSNQLNHFRLLLYLFCVSLVACQFGRCVWGGIEAFPHEQIVKLLLTFDLTLLHQRRYGGNFSFD